MLYNTENPHGGDIYAGGVTLDFSANTNPFGTPEGVKAVVAASLDTLSLYPDPYCRRLVAAIAAHERVPKDMILCGSGAAELIYSCCEALSPKTALELAPAFSEYSLALSRAGCKILRHRLSEDEGFCVSRRLLYDIERFRPEAVFICDPNNPTGRLMDAGLKADLLEVCRKNNIRLFADECFTDLAGGASYAACTKYAPHLTVLKAFTKSYGMAGLRLGYVISSDSELLKKMSRAVQPWNVSTAAQAAGAAALGETEFIEKTRRLIKKERPRLAAELCSLGFTVFPSDANFLLFKADPALGARLLERGVALRDCSNFYGLGPGFYRTAVKLPEENDALIDAVKAIRAAQ